MKNYITYYLYLIKYFFELKYLIYFDKQNRELHNASYFAFKTHHSVRQRYDDKYPYYYHIKMVTSFVTLFKSCLSENDYKNAFKIACGHDLIEDCRLTYNDVKDAWGVVIADGVYACTELRGKNRKERHGPEYVTGLQESLLGTFVKLCDLIANMTMGKRTGSRMFSMYQKEYPNNRKNLYREEFNDIFIYFEKELL